MAMSRKYFGTDGIRGQANSYPMTADMAMKVAMATALVLRSRRGDRQTNRVIIGKDTRLSGYMLEEAMCAGFVSMGMETLLVGPIPTPGIAMLTRSMRADLGVMISASHNLFQDNGIKLFGADGYKLDDALEMKIETKLDSDLTSELALPADLGKAIRLEDALGRYVEFIKASFPKGLSLEGLKVVIDCANGAAYKVAPQVLWELEANVLPMGVEPNGRNINDVCGATSVEALQREVVEQNADIGIALDGDADRIIVIDEKGKKIDGDQLMATLALDMQRQGTLQGGGVVATVMSNLGLERLLKSHEINLVRTPVGDRYVVEEMRNGGYNLGGEQSGHIIMSDFGTTGDGLLAGLQALALLKKDGKPASEVFSAFRPVPQLLRNVRFCGDNPMENKNVLAAIEDAELKLSNDGRVLVRSSGTEPLVRVMAEGDDAQRIDSVVSDICAVIEKVSA